MNEPIFAKTRYWYDSYTDLWKLVELSGFKTCYVDEIDLEKEGLFITAPVNGELRPHMDYRRSILKGIQKPKIVWWNLERPDSGRQFSIRNMREENSEILRYVDAIWVSDRYFQSLDPRMTFVVLGSHSQLMEDLGEDPKETIYDLAPMAYLNPRRTTILAQLKNFRIAPNAWGKERARILARTSVMLNIHQTDAQIVEPLRFALAAAYGMALISETCADPYPLVNGHDILMSDYGNLGNYTGDLIYGQRLGDAGLRLKDKLTVEWTFRRGVKEVLARMSL